MGQLIDSSVLISLERRGIGLDALQVEPAGEDLALAAITAAELLMGLHRAYPASRRARRESFVEAMISALPL